MVLVILLSGAMLLILPAITRLPARRVAPRLWARMCLGALVAGVAVVELAVLLLAAPTVLHALGAPGLAALCHRLLGPLTPGGAAMGWAASAAALALPVLLTHRLVTARRRCGELAIEPWLGEHCEWEGRDLVVLPTDEVVAFSVESRCSQIVVSRGLVDSLSPGEYEMVLRHEAAHLEHRHHRYLLLASALERSLSVVPLLARSTRSLRTALERWADEEAAGASRRARSDLRSALLGLAAVDLECTAAAFSAADTVLERLVALESPPLRPGVSPARLLVPGLAVALVGLSALVLWIGDVRVLVALAGHCPL